MTRFRKFVCVLLALALAACSGAAEIPREQIGAEQYQKPGNYHIRLKGWNEYYARRYSVTDTTLVIEELDRADDHYKRMKHDMPIVVPLKDVVSVSTSAGTNWFATSLAVLTAAAVVGFVVWFVIALGSSGLGAD